jgi:hypothetical protein
MPKNAKPAAADGPGVSTAVKNPDSTTAFFVWDTPALLQWLEAMCAHFLRQGYRPENRPEFEAMLALFRNWETAPETLRDKITALAVVRFSSDPATFGELLRLGIVTRAAGRG